MTQLLNYETLILLKMFIQNLYYRCKMAFEIMHLSPFNLRNEKEDLRVDLLFFRFYDMRWIIQGLSVV